MTDQERRLIKRIEDMVDEHRVAAPKIFREGTPLNAAVMSLNMILFDVWKIRDELIADNEAATVVQ